VLTIELHCDVCARKRAFEQPPCRDRHEPNCPEWVCTGCDTALLVGPWPVDMLRIRRRDEVTLARPRRLDPAGRPAGIRRSAA